VKANFIDIYRKMEGETEIRTVNVTGTLNVLEFVCSVKTKVLFHASTIVANGAVDEEKRLSESWPAPEEFDDSPNSAYPVSKFVCDRLVFQAVERGVPVKVFRFPVIAGDSQTGGNVTVEDNQLMLRLLSYMNLKAIPALPVPFFILPVDVCSKLSLSVFFNDASPNEVYNIYNPNSCNETEFQEVARELGFNVELLEPDAYLEKLSSQDETSKLTQALTMWSGDKEMKKFLEDRSPAVGTAWTHNPKNAFISRKLCALCPELYPEAIEHPISIIKRDMMHAKESGVFEKFGIVPF
jgi:thioester reductase-like protein